MPQDDLVQAPSVSILHRAPIPPCCAALLRLRLRLRATDYAGHAGDSMRFAGNSLFGYSANMPHHEQHIGLSRARRVHAEDSSLRLRCGKRCPVSHHYPSEVFIPVLEGSSFSPRASRLLAAACRQEEQLGWLVRAVGMHRGPSVPRGWLAGRTNYGDGWDGVAIHAACCQWRGRAGSPPPRLHAHRLPSSVIAHHRAMSGCQGVRVSGCRLRLSVCQTEPWGCKPAPWLLLGQDLDWVGGVLV
jgi:hypothetical protein